MVRPKFLFRPPKPGQVSPSKPTNERYYDYTNSNVGIAVIFCQENFDHSNVVGRSKDAQDLRNVLSNLGFMVQVLKDYKIAEIRKCLLDLSKYDHSDNDCLIVSIMTNGENEGRIFASDGKFMVNELWENFTGNNCPSLIGKPKLFFIQTGLGGSLRFTSQDKVDPGASYDLSNPRSTSLPTISGMLNSKMTQNDQFRYVIPTLADFLVMFSSIEGFYSFRNPQEGSWFIQALCQELTENSHEEIMTILTGVNRRVAFGKQSYVPNNPEWDASKQMPIIQTMLTKSFYILTKEQKAKMRQRKNLLVS